MDKKLFYLIVGVLAVLLVVLAVTVSFLGSRDNQPPDVLTSDQLPTQIPQDSQIPNSTDSNKEVFPSPAESTPEAVAQEFYEWYTTTQNPLGSGAYKKSPIISDYFMETLDGFVVANDHLTGDPVLACVDVRLIKDLVVQPALYDQTNLQASVALDSLAGDGASYKVILSNINSRWLVDDIRCNL